MIHTGHGVRLASLAVLFGTGLSGCVTVQDRISHREDDLAAAGFVVRPANTPDRQAMLARLPANKFVQRANGDEVHYVYADPIVCHCLYVGSQEAFGAFKKHEQEQRLADEAQMTATMYSDPAWTWGAWGPWGAPGFRFGYGPMGF